MLVSVSSAPSASARADTAEIVAPYDEQATNADQSQADRAQTLATLAPATPARSPLVSAPARPHPKHEKRAPLSRVYLQHCALLL